MNTKPISIIVLLIALILPSASTLAQTPAGMAQDQLLAKSLPADEVLWLETKSGKFLSLQRPHMSATRRGIAILISDINMPLNSPQIIEPLRKSLNSVGWSTLSITPPSSALLSGTSDSEVVEPKTTESKEGTTSPYVSELIARLNAAIKWGNKEHKHNVVIVQGRQMAYLIDAMMSQHLSPIEAIVTLDANQAFMHKTEPAHKFPHDEKEFAKQLSKLTIPILDIYQQQRSKLEKHAVLRKQMARKNHANYRQVELTAFYNDALLAKTIYGWLSRNQKAMMGMAAKKK